jgi:hypothetical protein
MHVYREWSSSVGEKIKQRNSYLSTDEYILTGYEPGSSTPQRSQYSSNLKIPTSLKHLIPVDCRSVDLLILFVPKNLYPDSAPYPLRSVDLSITQRHHELYVHLQAWLYRDAHPSQLSRMEG